LDEVRAPGDGRPPNVEVVVWILCVRFHGDPFLRADRAKLELGGPRRRGLAEGVR
jgi:hypothetical protein